MLTRESVIVALCILATMPAFASPRLVTTTVDDSETVTLSGNTPSERLRIDDRGPLADDQRLDHLQMLLRSSAETDAALVRYVDALHDPASPFFHKWLTAESFTDKFGPDASDVAAVTVWLQSKGFSVNGVVAGRMIIDFSGTAAQIRSAFSTEIHNVVVHGVPHITNFNDPKIPRALAGIVSGIVSLHNFRPHTNYKTQPSFTVSGTSEAMVPADLAKVYNFTPLFKSGITGIGQTVVLIEDSDVYNTADWATFRTAFGLSGYKDGSFSQIHPSSNAHNCSDPGVITRTEIEATLDAEWGSAAAPSAAMVIASCADTSVSFGGLIALENIVDSAMPPQVVSISYGQPESLLGVAGNATYSRIYKQAVAEGTSIFVAAGDAGAAVLDEVEDNDYAQNGITESGFATTPYDVAVGGTDFSDTYSNTVSTYWNTHNNMAHGSAKSYIPEIPWNNTCASVLLSKANGFKVPYGAKGFCDSAAAGYLDNLVAGGGGPSNCAKTDGSGNCAGYPKPSWQSVFGNPGDAVRDVPDVSLFAANGIWGHYLVLCDSYDEDAVHCSGKPKTWSGAGGTSFAAPIMAGIQALIDQKKGGSQGNPNPVFYSLAATEYGAHGNSECNSSLGNTVAKSCVFYDVTLGDNDVLCYGPDCFMDGDTEGEGVLSTSSTAYKPAFAATTGWDFSTGIGTVNVNNLVNNY